MITGFNTDIQHEGVTYHVQTEDKGLDSPLILSLVYVGGAIIANKRTPYHDLIDSGFDEQALTERLQRQHKLICAAIKAGRVEDLKRMGGPPAGAPKTEPASKKAASSSEAKKPGGQRRKKAEPAKPPVQSAPTDVDIAPAGVDSAPAIAGSAPAGVDSVPVVVSSVPAVVGSVPAVLQGGETGAAAERAATDSGLVMLMTLSDEISALGDFRARSAPALVAPTEVAPQVREKDPEVEAEPDLSRHEPDLNRHEPDLSSTVSGAVFEKTPKDSSDEIYLSLLDDEGDFRAGQLATVKIHVGRGTYGRMPVADAFVTVKVLGTSFRPLILSTTTDELGLAIVRAMLPRFTSGRAAIIIRAVSGEDAAEMRRIIHQS
ncbi:MAG: hypothetical protein QOJ76_3302 [Acidobacteriota bacterium]|nr:hypothetical protein [Acidobacteriota bacterium]